MTNQFFSDDRPFKIINHVCRHCTGRLLARRFGTPEMDIEALGSHREYEIRCADCGATATGDHESICWCGVDSGAFGQRLFECVKNPNPNPAMPGEICVREREPIPETPEPNRPRDHRPAFSHEDLAMAAV